MGSGDISKLRSDELALLSRYATATKIPLERILEDHRRHEILDAMMSGLRPDVIACMLTPVSRHAESRTHVDRCGHISECIRERLGHLLGDQYQKHECFASVMQDHCLNLVRSNELHAMLLDQWDDYVRALGGIGAKHISHITEGDLGNMRGKIGEHVLHILMNDLLAAYRETHEGRAHVLHSVEDPVLPTAKEYYLDMNGSPYNFHLYKNDVPRTEFDMLVHMQAQPSRLYFLDATTSINKNRRRSDNAFRQFRESARVNDRSVLQKIHIACQSSHFGVSKDGDIHTVHLRLGHEVAYFQQRTLENLHRIKRYKKN